MTSHKSENTDTSGHFQTLGNFFQIPPIVLLWKYARIYISPDIGP